MSENNKSTLETEIFAEYEAAKAELDKVVKEKEEAANDILEKFNKEQEIVAEKMATLKTSLEENSKKHDEVYATYKNALLQDEQEDILRIETEIRDLERDRFRLELELEALSENGFTTDIEDFINQYRSETVLQIKEAQEKKNTAVDDLLRIQKELESIGNRINGVCYFHSVSSGMTTMTLDDKMISIYEMKYGPIDVKGNRCGGDREAKRRFMSGITMGLENTEAGKKLIGGNEDE